MNVYITVGELLLTDIADAYFQLTKIIYLELEDNLSNEKRMKDGFKRIMNFLKGIHLIKKYNKNEETDERIPIWNNKSHALDALNIYVNTMDNLRQAKLTKKYSKRAFVISIIALVLSSAINIGLTILSIMLGMKINE